MAKSSASTKTNKKADKQEETKQEKKQDQTKAQEKKQAAKPKKEGSKKEGSKKEKPKKEKPKKEKKSSKDKSDNQSDQENQSKDKADKAKKPTQEKTSKSKKKSGPKPKTMEELLDMTGYEPVVPQKGEKIEGLITAKTNNMLRLDLNAKTEGVVAEREFDFAQDYIEDLQVGDKVKATVISVENSRGLILLSLKGAASDAKWEYFEDALEEETPLDAEGVEVNKGGLIAEVNGVRGFVPSSQFSRRYIGSLDQLKGEVFQVLPIEVDREKNRLIFSERHVSEAKQLAQKAKALEVVEEGGVYEGVISGVKSFGLFMTVEIPLVKEEELAKTDKEASDKKVEAGADKEAKADKETKKSDDKAKDDEVKKEEGSQGKGEKDQTKEPELPSDNIGYIEGLIHISEISWEKVNHPRDYHQVGDRVKVKVLGVDEDSGKLNLSIKRLKQDPWQTVAEEYPVGTTFTGKVSRTEPFGVFVDVMPGVDGLIHVSKLDPTVKLKEGDEVTVNVDSIEPDKRRMSLSMVLTEVPMGYK